MRSAGFSFYLLRLLLCIGSFFGIIALAVHLWPWPLVLAAIYLGAASAFLLWKGERGDGIYFFVPFVIAPCGELLAVAHGAWSYAGADSGIPVWLPFAWGISGICMRRSSITVEALFVFTVSKLHSTRSRREVAN